MLASRPSQHPALGSGPDIGIRAVPNFIPIAEEFGESSASFTSLTADMDSMKLAINRLTEEMKKLQADRAADRADRLSEREELKSLISGFHQQPGPESINLPRTPQSPGRGQIQTPPTDRSTLLSNERPLLLTPPLIVFGHLNNQPVIDPLSSPRSSTESPVHSKPRLDFPLFDILDVHGWLYKVEQLLEYDNVHAEQQVKMVALYLGGGPLRWCQWTMRATGALLYWDSFKRGLITMYDSSPVLDYAGELTKLKQEGGSYEDYLIGIVYP